ncbi:MAG TPA: alkaline phosphatase family protein [Acidobacteriota bacterium]|nr:alkaline phosphatase family protein [Acidobacteriota bacterium]
MTQSGSRKNKRVCVIGLDGVPYDLLLGLAQSGIMPAMHRLIQSGYLLKMKASLPEVSSVSWTSYMTGTNPGVHGIFGFTDLRENSYQIRFPNSLDVKSPTLWERLGEMGLKSIIINQPSTYPARKMEGALVAGFVAIELAKAVYPLSHLAALEKMGYQTDIDTQKARQDRTFLWKELNSTLEGGRKAFQYFWEQEWNLFEFVVTGTDRLHHYLWDAYADSGHPSHADFVDYYRKVDGLIEQIAERFQALTGGVNGLYLLSDHGFTGIVQELYLNAWLQHAGYLMFDGSPPNRLADMAPGTRAFALDPSRIYINLKGRFPRGVVEKTEKKDLKLEISAALKQLEFDGQRVIREVFDAEEIYSGPYVGKGPDLIVLAERGFDLKGSLEMKGTFGRSDLQGMHTWDDAFFWASKQCGPNLAISDVAVKILEDFE